MQMKILLTSILIYNFLFIGGVLSISLLGCYQHSQFPINNTLDTYARFTIIRWNGQVCIKSSSNKFAESLQFIENAKEIVKHEKDTFGKLVDFQFVPYQYGMTKIKAVKGYEDRQIFSSPTKLFLDELSSISEFKYDVLYKQLYNVLKLIEVNYHFAIEYTKFLREFTEHSYYKRMRELNVWKNKIITKYHFPPLINNYDKLTEEVQRLALHNIDKFFGYYQIIRTDNLDDNRSVQLKKTSIIYMMTHEISSPIMSMLNFCMKSSKLATELCFGCKITRLGMSSYCLEILKDFEVLF